MVAYEQAAGVPMAVPESCSHVVLPKLKILLLITSLSVLRKRLTGKLTGISVSWDVKKSQNDWMPAVVSILVYIDLASAEKSRALLGISRVFRSPRTSKEFFV